MNDRIRRLMEQAIMSIDGQTFGKTYIPDAFTEKFAELIVEECCEVAHCNFHVDGLTLGGMLKEHFGVEE